MPEDPLDTARTAPLADGPELRARLPVTVIMQITPSPQHRWMSERRETRAVVARTAGASPVLSEEPLARTETRIVRFDSLTLDLHPDEAETYFQNLSTDTPRCFVVMTHDDAENGCEPFLVTASPDLAASYESVDHVVDAVPLDASLHTMVEAFMLTHYVPEKMLKRKRRDWKES